MNPHISLPRHNDAGPSSFGGFTPSSSSRHEGVRMPRFFKRMFKFPQMDFELATWEMTSLIIAPKKVFRSIYYHVCPPGIHEQSPLGRNLWNDTDLRVAKKQTKNTWHRPDPSFMYLLSFFLLLTSIAWSLAYADGFTRTLKITLVFIFVHFIGTCLLVSTAAYFLVGRLLGPGVKGLPGRKRPGLFVQPGDGEALEFGYCWDVSIRAFFPVWVFVYVVQFILMPVVAKDIWISRLFGNFIYLVAFSYYSVITFLGYNALPFLHHTELLLAPIPLFVVLWGTTVFGWNAPKHLAPVLWAGATLRKHV